MAAPLQVQTPAKVPKNIFEAAQMGNEGWIVNKAERSLQFDINQVDKLKRNALHYAADEGHEQVVRTLIDYGIDVEVKEVNGRTAIHLAAIRASEACLQLILDAIPDPEVKLEMVNCPDKFGLTPVFLAYQKGKAGFPTFLMLIKHGAKWDAAPGHQIPIAKREPKEAPADAAAAEGDAAAAAVDGEAKA